MSDNDDEEPDASSGAHFDPSRYAQDALTNVDIDNDDGRVGSPLERLRSLSGDPQSPIIAFNYETLSQLRNSGVSAATALALLQEAVRIGKTNVINVILETYKDQVHLVCFCTFCWIFDRVYLLYWLARRRKWNHALMKKYDIS